MFERVKLLDWVRPRPRFVPRFKQRLFLHVGCHRTGTTSIQNYMRSNAVRLAQRGYFLPNGRGRHSGLMAQLMSGEMTAEALAEQLHAEALAQVGPQAAILLSDEDVSQHEDLAPLQALRHFFEVTVLFSMRRQDTWLESWYFQNIKWQWNPALSHLTWPEFLDRRAEFHWIDYAAHVGKLERLFGRKNLRLSVFERGQMPQGPVVDFCNKIGLKDREGFSTPPHVNASLSAEMTAFFRHLPLDQISTVDRAIFRNALERVDRSLLGHMSKQSERLMPLDRRKSVLAQFEAGNKALARRYFGRRQLFLDPLPAADAALAKLDMPHARAEVIQRFVGPMLTQLLQEDMLSLPPEQGANPR